MIKQKNYYRTIVEIIPIAAIILVFSCIIPETIYYWCYGIDFLGYLDFSQALVQLSWDFIYFIAGSLLILTMFSNVMISSASQRVTPKSKFYKIITFSAVILFLILVLKYYPNILVSTLISFLPAIVSLGFTLFILWSIREIKRRKANWVQNIGIITIGGFVIYIILLTGIGFGKFLFSISEKPQKEIVLYLDGSEKIYSSDSLRFIGMTESAYFFYNLPESTAIVIPSKDVKEVFYKRIE